MRINNDYGYFDPMDLMGWAISFILLITAIFLLFIPYSIYQSAGVDAKIYNAKYGTNYTQSDFFWSGETIKSFLNGGKQTTQNLNINGALPVRITE